MYDITRISGKGVMLDSEKCPIDNRWNKVGVTKGTSLVLHKTDNQDNIAMSIRGLVDISRAKEDQVGCVLLSNIER